ncbi:MAG: Lysine exporter protein [Bacilli bacterium]|nr:Lysine exporter protein [Bacilli bacterium]
MGWTAIFTGILIGFSIAAPVGPIGVLCIRRTLTQGRIFGLISGLGAASADAIFVCIAAFGLSAISNFLIEYQLALRLTGGFFLCYLGMQTYRTQPAIEPAAAKSCRLFSSYSSTFFLTLTNPMTILSFMAIMAGLGFSEAPAHSLSSLLFVFGVFIGSAAWWFILTIGLGLLRNRMNPHVFVWINRISGLIVITCGITALFSTLK